MKRWIGYKNGKFGGVYEGDSIQFGELTIDDSVSDQDLFTIGVLRLRTIPPEHPDIPRWVVEGPLYEFVNDGSAEVTERFVYRYELFDDLKRRKLQELYFAKDELLKDGLTYNGVCFDLRFRNIAYLSILSTLISSGKYPENFQWFDKEGSIVPLSETECLGLIEASAQFILYVETTATKMLKKIESITDIHELNKTEIRLKDE